jgi:hypothetical protein
MPEFSHNALATLLNLIDYGEAVKERTIERLAPQFKRHFR